MKILLLSDTHSYMDERILEYAKNADEIWHCGDFGSMEVIEELEKIKTVRGVYGNIDGDKIRKIFPEVSRFTCEDVEVLMIHIGGYPGKYSPLAKKEIAENPPKLFISGHSHILKAMFDPKNNLLHLNPGAAGNQGWHKVRTMMRFEINGDKIEHLEIIELGARGVVKSNN
ncbi:metallophosphoesterase [Chryseobacterium koreense]|uniref:metallophosphoesterase family protein n=1 Tax=Chryseobacterium koreense TaxID=232216 RepID=UPI0026F2547B|nr:metallophosphoesterase family protein [Chryseobacterium koreense]